MVEKVVHGVVVATVLAFCCFDFDVDLPKVVVEVAASGVVPAEVPYSRVLIFVLVKKLVFGGGWCHYFLYCCPKILIPEGSARSLCAFHRLCC